MEISGLSAASSALSAAKTGDAVATLVMKKALDMEEKGALQLVQTATQVGAKNPSHLGQSVDILV